MSNEYSQTTVRLAAVVQRFVDAEHKRFQDRPYPDWSKFQENAVARAQGYIISSVEHAAKTLRQNIEKWFGNSFQFHHLEWNGKVSLSKAKQFEDILRVHAPIHLNCQHLESTLDELRRNCKNYEAFDQAIHIDGAAGIKLDAARNGWNRNGSESIIASVVELIRTHLGVEVKLLNQDEALEHMMIVFEQYATSYELIMSHAHELACASAEATRS